MTLLDEISESGVYRFTRRFCAFNSSENRTADARADVLHRFHRKTSRLYACAKQGRSYVSKIGVSIRRSSVQKQPDCRFCEFL